MITGVFLERHYGLGYGARIDVGMNKIPIMNTRFPSFATVLYVLCFYHPMFVAMHV